MPRRMGTALPLVDLLEKEWDAQLFNSKKGLATTLGWESYHTVRSQGSRSGFPDRTLWRERLLFVELKTEKGKPTDEQSRVLNGLARSGAEVYLWRPSDLDEIALILGSRSVFDARSRFVITPVGARGRDFRPGSLWMPPDGALGLNGSRADDRNAEKAA